MVKRVVLKLGEMTAIVALTVCVMMVLTGGVTMQQGLDAGTTAGGDPCSSAPTEAGGTNFLTADPNGTDTTSITDALYILQYLFAGGPEPVIPCNAGSDDFTEEEVEILSELAQYVSIVNVDDPESTDPDDVYPTVVFTECNVQIVNGTGATNGELDDICSVGATSTEVNGLGNLIVGYNELRNQTPLDPDDIECDRDDLLDDYRSGSHNLVVGTRLNYSSFGGAVFGRTNEISGPYATVAGGFENEATFLCAHVCGGCTNAANGGFSTVTGGRSNVADAFWTVVVGGGDAELTDGNTASTAYSVVVGGIQNESTGLHAVVVGGSDNVASGEDSVVSGGNEREATGEDDWVAGSLLEDD